jgi:hypothetical protein
VWWCSFRSCSASVNFISFKFHVAEVPWYFFGGAQVQKFELRFSPFQWGNPKFTGEK